MTLTIGLTGGIGSGKSAASEWFCQQGIDIIDADVIAHAITDKGSPVLDELSSAFGDWVINADGTYNRPAMRTHILDNPSAIHRLNAITHPYIQTQIKTALACSTSIYRILAVPLLVEGMTKSPNLAELCDRILVVDVPESLQIERASQRDAHKLSHQDAQEYIKTIIAKQAHRTQRLAVADDVVDNSQSLAHLHTQLQALHAFYLQLAQGKSVK